MGGVLLEIISSHSPNLFLDVSLVASLLTIQRKMVGTDGSDGN